MLKEMIQKTLMLSAIIIVTVFAVSYFFFDAQNQTLIVFQILFLSFMIVLLQRLLKRNLFELFLLNLILEYLLVSGFVLLYGFFCQWFGRENWWLVFLYVAAVYVPAYFLDVAITKKDIAFINQQLERRRMEYEQQDKE